MPLWKIHHPADAYSDADKKEFAETITGIYTQIPIPAFYVVTIFEEVTGNNVYVGGRAHERFVRIQVDQMARTLPGPVIREWWVHMLDEKIRPFVGDRGYDWELTCSELPADLWSLQGIVPPPFSSVAEKRWVRENKALAYTQGEMLPASFVEAAEKGEVLLAPGVHGS
jgi:phenylpyruvate tautomerase PptA (4-oxalocrotonate tautomerase family)